MQAEAASNVRQNISQLVFGSNNNEAAGGSGRLGGVQWRHILSADGAKNFRSAHGPSAADTTMRSPLARMMNRMDGQLLQDEPIFLMTRNSPQPRRVRHFYGNKQLIIFLQSINPVLFDILLCLPPSFIIVIPSEHSGVRSTKRAMISVRRMQQPGDKELFWSSPLLPDVH